jgi:MFS family permease
VIVTLAYQLSQGGVDTAQVATVVAVSVFPHTWKFVWAPLVDTTLTRKRWYLIGAGLTAAGILACGMVPTDARSLPVLNALVFLMSTATTLVGMSTEALIAHHTPDSVRGRVAGWFQAGNLGGQGIGGGAGLWMVQHVSPPWISAGVIGLTCALCAVALLWIGEPMHGRPADASPDRPAQRLLPTLIDQWLKLVAVLRSVWILVQSRRGFLVLVIVFLPLNTGAASNLWAAVADGWHASADTVALINGTLGGFASAFGCLIGGFACDRLDRKSAYLAYGAAQAFCAVAMALAPHTEDMFAVFTLLYAVVTGMGFAGFCAVVLETIGASAAATQYNVYSSLSNMPILYMALVEGWTYQRFGASAMLYAEAGLAAVSIGLFAAASALTFRRNVALATE